MSESDLAREIDPARLDEFEKIVQNAAQIICGEQPDVPEPHSLVDLDSFSMVQVLLELENETETMILDRFEGFVGETFRDLAEFIIRLMDQDEAARQNPDAPPSA